MVSIRLKKMGRKGQPSFRIVVADSRRPRDGAVIDEIGHYLPYVEENKVKLDLQKYEEWLKKGAQPTNAVKNLVKIAQNSQSERKN